VDNKILTPQEPPDTDAKSTARTLCFAARLTRTNLFMAIILNRAAVFCQALLSLIVVNKR
jgi:hypothetical protein